MKRAYAVRFFCDVNGIAKIFYSFMLALVTF